MAFNNRRSYIPRQSSNVEVFTVSQLSYTPALDNTIYIGFASSFMLRSIDH